MAVYSYSRVSEIEALRSPEKLEKDLHHEMIQLQTFALSQGMRLDGRFEDRGVAWTTDLMDRMDGTRLMNTVRNGDAVVVLSLQRIFSNCADLAKTLKAFKKSGVKLYVTELGGNITDAGFSPPFERVAKVFSGLERRRSTERIKTVKQNQRRKGRFLGGSRPFGYMIHSNGRLIENPMEQRVLKKIFDMKNQGKSLRAISAEVSTPMTPVSFKTVQRLLHRHGHNGRQASSGAK